MKNDITEWLSAAALIKVLSSGQYLPGRPPLLRLASSALYLDRRALRTATQRSFQEIISHGECFETIESLLVWLRMPAGDLPGIHAL